PKPEQFVVINRMDGNQQPDLSCEHVITKRRCDSKESRWEVISCSM
ncbi:unnamed protein product, partial [Onchocerca ochengi]